ncbi:lipoprotein [Cupriavidus basilensis]|uniref:Lipoprotein n=1 Tax=Cupriavidus basilensis TaxID=68895 RepID=A0ABT6AQV2_9BURK|nr:lipoprotein [Cupriavidus basilensis]MDF3835011.1 lipoprotein [Cupriavidus basilensis]
MLRRVAIVSAIAANLAMPLLSGCGIRGPLVMPKQPPAPAQPGVPDPGLSNPAMPLPAAQGSAPAPAAPPTAK